MKITIREVINVSKKKVICDTNVWYGYNQDKPTEISDDYILIPTSLTLVELATSEVMVHDIKLFQNTVKTIYEKCGPIIPSDPIDYVLSQQDQIYPTKDNVINKLLEGFSSLLDMKIDEKTVLDDDLKKKIIEQCKAYRKATGAFADFGNSKIDKIRKNINKGIGKKKHLEIDTTSQIKELVKSIFNEHTKDIEYTINWDKFDWGKIDLFMKVTESFLKKLETTNGMKIKANDEVDWLNMLYVSPDDKYLTLEGSWKDYIKNDDRIKHYLYE